jgi:hypothetical protein
MAALVTADPPLIVTVAIVVPLYTSCTVPVADAGDTVAVNIIVSHAVAGFTEEVSVTLEAAWLTVCTTAAEVLPRSLGSPLYTAVMECVPTARVETANAAVPPVRVAAPMGVPPSRNCAVPVADTGDTAATKVTDCPKVEGFGLELSVVVVLLCA